MFDFDDNRIEPPAFKVAVSDDNRIEPSAFKVSISGWIASFLGLYLIGTGVYNIVQLSQAGDSAAQQSSEILRQSGIDANSAPITIVVSYIVGAPIFAGSGLLALGSIARHIKKGKR